ncbi:hypothetical protein Purlil1_3800 [Purpureocillium lilacinum]|uniref:Uncharacterized protein n=1 Tax=Purpureocillium lilacinum TaxID=33203 RepID=A0ABR0C6G1_PURLI|nr:hypothetical protein Purlil1_3800 [Purpureocillium lilacinum]
MHYANYQVHSRVRGATSYKRGRRTQRLGLHVCLDANWRFGLDVDRDVDRDVATASRNMVAAIIIASTKPSPSGRPAHQSAGRPCQAGIRPVSSLTQSVAASSPRALSPSPPPFAKNDVLTVSHHDTVPIRSGGAIPETPSADRRRCDVRTRPAGDAHAAQRTTELSRQGPQAAQEAQVQDKFTATLPGRGPGHPDLQP